MKLQETKVSDSYAITHCGDGYILLNKERRVESGIVVMPHRIVDNWGSGGFDALTTADMETLRDLGVTIVLIGTGKRQRFPHPSLLRPLMEARIGFEIMDLAAACRTYNVLMSEGRSVAAALLFD